MGQTCILHRFLQDPRGRTTPPADTSRSKFKKRHAAVTWREVPSTILRHARRGLCRIEHPSAEGRAPLIWRAFESPAEWTDDVENACGISEVPQVEDGCVLVLPRRLLRFLALGTVPRRQFHGASCLHRGGSLSVEEFRPARFEAPSMSRASLRNSPGRRHPALGSADAIVSCGALAEGVLDARGGCRQDNRDAIRPRLPLRSPPLNGDCV